jgi:hypothetical protein
MTPIPAKVLTVDKQSSQYRVLVQIELEKYLGSFHFIKASPDGEAYEILRQIARDRALRGGSGFIKGAYTCVCFADLSLSLAKIGFANAGGNSRYTRFGVMVPKEWLFAQGGRPVIYQPDDEFTLLPESHRWRHVTFNLGDNPVDFTWERE